MENESQPGYIYIMTNPAMPGLVKVGMTRNPPEERAVQLSTTGVPIHFEIEYYGRVDNRFIAEKCAHNRLKNYHHGKEFFKVDVGVAIYCVETISQPIKRIFIKHGNSQKVIDYIIKKREVPYDAMVAEWIAHQKQKAKIFESQSKILASERRERDFEKQVEEYIRKVTGKAESLFNYKQVELPSHPDNTVEVKKYDHSNTLLPSDLFLIEENAKKLAAELKRAEQELERAEQELEKKDREAREARTALDAEKSKGFFKRLFS